MPSRRVFISPMSAWIFWRISIGHHHYVGGSREESLRLATGRNHEVRTGVLKLDDIRARAHAALSKVPGRMGERLRDLNETLGRPLADEEELADRRAFEARALRSEPSVAKPAAPAREVAPVIVYHMDKTRRDATKLTDMLDAEGVPYQCSNIQEDAAAQMAVRRDSKGYRLPVVFIAGEAVGGRAELSNLIASGELKKRVFGG
jgi:glutaredoxin